MEELKPCPFCGGEATLLEIPPHKHIIVDLPDYSGGAFVECTKCTAAISGETVEEAIEIWNRRAKKICPTCGSTESYGRKVCVVCNGNGGLIFDVVKVYWSEWAQSPLDRVFTKN